MDWLVELLEVFIYFELGFGKSIWVWLQLQRKFLELGDDVFISEKLDAKLLGPLALVDGLADLDVLSDLSQGFLNDLLLDEHATEFKILST